MWVVASGYCEPLRLAGVRVLFYFRDRWFESPSSTITSGEQHQLEIAAQSLSWTIKVEPDGRLVDMTSDVYWEATYVTYALFCVAPTALLTVLPFSFSLG